MSQTPSPESINPRDVPPTRNTLDGGVGEFGHYIGMTVEERKAADAKRDAARAHQIPTDDRIALLVASLQRAIHRDPNPNGRWKGAILSNDGSEIGVDVTEDGLTRTFILSVREV